MNGKSKQIARSLCLPVRLFEGHLRPLGESVVARARAFIKVLRLMCGGMGSRYFSYVQAGDDYRVVRK